MQGQGQKLILSDQKEKSLHLKIEKFIIQMGQTYSFTNLEGDKHIILNGDKIIKKKNLHTIYKY